MLLKFCGGGDNVPAATSSGPVLLVEFTTSPYGTFVQTPSRQSLNGFQLEVIDDADITINYVISQRSHNSLRFLRVDYLESNRTISVSIQIFKIEVSFVDIQSPTYIKNTTLCEFWIRGTGHGELESPRHSLPPNSTCLYHLQVGSILLDHVESSLISSRNLREQKLRIDPMTNFK